MGKLSAQSSGRKVPEFTKCSSLSRNDRRTYNAAGSSWRLQAESLLIGMEGRSKSACQFISRPSNVSWFPTYGCALVASQPFDGCGVDLLCVDHRVLLLVALDNWSLVTSSSPHGVGQTSTCDSHVSLYCGAVPSSLLPDLHELLQHLINKRRDDSAKHNKKGFQRTPEFIRVVLADTLTLLAQGVTISNVSTLRSSDLVNSTVTMPRGGFTDVGLHTGGTPRATSWPLVQETLLAVLQHCCLCAADQQPEVIVVLAMTHLDMWLLAQQLPLLRPETATPIMLNVCMTMLNSAAQKAAALAIDGHKTSRFESQLQAARQHIQVAAAERASQLGKQYMLPSPSSADCQGHPDMSGAWRLPKGVVPATPAPQGLATGRAAAASDAIAALGALPVAMTCAAGAVAAGAAVLGTKLQQLQLLLQGLSQHDGDVAAQHAASRVEDLLFGCAVAGFDCDSSRLQSETEVESLWQLISSYRNIMAKYRQSRAAAATMAVEMHSREALVTWVAYCMVYELAKLQVPLVGSFSVALSWKDPQHFVLHDKAAVDAAIGVSSYLHTHTSSPAHRLFSLWDDGKGTAAFAMQFVANDSNLSSILEQHQLDMDQSAEMHWTEVQRKQQLFAELTADSDVNELRSSLATVNEQLRPLEADRAELETQASRISHRLKQLQWATNTHKVSERNSLLIQQPDVQNRKSALDKKIQPLQSQKHTLESQLTRLSDARQAPASVIQPVPEDIQVAQQWIFWLHKPKLLDQLADISFLAQQLLLPTPCNSEVQAAIQVGDMVTSIVDHYNAHQVSHYHTPDQELTGSDNLVRTFAMAHVPSASSIGPQYVDQISNKQQGVWYPDELLPIMSWSGSGTAADQVCRFPPSFNPFSAIDLVITAEKFTERLPVSCKDSSKLQWAMLQRGSRAATRADRGNVGIACQDEKPDWLSKPGYLAFTSLRAYPIMQLRSLCIALREQHLPLGHPAVVTLVQQTVYQLGELIWTQDGCEKSSSCKGSIQLLWRRHWDAGGGELHALTFELQLLAEKLAEAPREHDAVLLLGQLAAYLSDWHLGCKEVAHQFAAMTSKAADQLEQQVQEAQVHNLDSVARQLQARQCKSRAVSLLCYGAGPLDAGDIAHMLQLVVLMKHGDLFLADTALADELQELRVQCRGVMAKRLPAVLAVLQQTAGSGGSSAVAGSGCLPGSCLLTAAVTAVLQWTPPQLQWTQVTDAAGQRFACFQAEGADGHVYSINILDGTVLLDGALPCRLPNSILQHPLYKRCFGSSNFEVGFTAMREYKTLRAIDGCYYIFYWAAPSTTSQHGSNSELVVIETEKESGLQLQLLDVGDEGTCGSWGRDLPVRLQQLYSHWLNQQHKTIILRPLHFQERSVSFLVRYSADDCFEKSVPATTQPTPAGTVLQCERVPTHLMSDHWLSLLDNRGHQIQTQPLVLADSSTHLQILSKFEDAAYIHVYASSHGSDCSQRSGPGSSAVGQDVPGTTCSGNSSSMSSKIAAVPELLFELPRFGLEFELREGRLLSKDHRGYCLSMCQQLVTKKSPGAATSDSIPSALPGAGDEANSSTDSSSRVGIESNTTVHYTLPGFQQYLILEPVHQDSTDLPRLADGNGTKLVLMPAGRVVQTRPKGSSSSSSKASATAIASVAIPTHAGASVLVHKYEVHRRFGHLRASDVLPRLQLAALYAATGTLLPEPGSTMTGAQTAMQLIRQSWVNRPLSPLEAQHLDTAAAFAGHFAPALRLLAAELQGSACQLQHLYRPAAAAEGSAEGADGKFAVLQPDTATVYKLQAMKLLPGGWQLHPKLRLSPDEEAQVMGISSTAAAVGSTPAWKRLGQYQPIDSSVPQSPMPAVFVVECEERLRQLVVACDSTDAQQRQTTKLVGHKRRQSGSTKADSGAVSIPEYPLRASESRSIPLESMMHAELQQSWEAHHITSAPTAVKQDAASVISEMQINVPKMRQEVQIWLLHHVSHIPEVTGAPAAAYRLLKTSSSVASASLLDLMCCAWQPQMMHELNPFLSGPACSRLHKGVLDWLQLCVLENKLTRLQQHVRAGADAASLLVQELLVYRTWDVTLHPKWLAFEVEGQLQIRPAQYDIAQHLITHPGAIMQLNMGEGKTRVILPMLALHWTQDRKHVVRLNFLYTLLHEAYSHLHQHLAASVLEVKLMLMPFHRDVTLTSQTARAVLAAISRCQKVGGLLLVVPEHRLSLQLKWHELQMRGGAASLAVCAELQALANMPYLDLLDESDEILHHRFQLVYACGAREALYARSERVSALQAVLLVLSRLADGGFDICPELHHKGVAAWPNTGQRPPGAFCSLQLLVGSALDAALPGLIAKIAAEVTASPSYELRWLTGVADKEALIRFVTDAAFDIKQVLDGDPSLTADQTDQLLELRGLLALGMLQHCLLKRHNVDYGINRSLTARKQLAVPFRAAHTPSERSEFAQPDVALLLTHLSYYADGLTLVQFTETLKQLQRMGRNAQQEYYNSWLALMPQDKVALDVLMGFDSIAKVDPTNSHLLEAMWELMSHNMAVVNFWLSFCLFPNQTGQYPQRLSCNAWHLADTAERQVYGFSGTNDNHRLLPLQVQQADMSHKPLLAATNGKMLDVMLHTSSYATLAQENEQQGHKPQWQALLDYALSNKVDAVLDCGALLAGTTNRCAAQYIRQRLQLAGTSSYQGVCYFDSGKSQWLITDTQGRTLPRHASPLAERDAFVIFDEARCRGADLVLKQQAVGLLTVGPAVCKDKLMQAAGRLRQLGKGQTLQVVGSPDVTDKMEAANALMATSSSNADSDNGRISMVHVLQWVMSNTVEATLCGVTQWASQGLHFAVTKDAPDRALQQDMLRPEDLDSSRRVSRPVADVVADMIDRKLRTTAGHTGGGAAVLAPEQQDLLERVQHNAAVYGAGHHIAAGFGVDEECERELEREQEEEEEQQVQVARVEPAEELDWDYASVITAAEPTLELISTQSQVYRLQEVMHMLDPESLRVLQWSDKVWVTKNFMLTSTAAAANWSGSSGVQFGTTTARAGISMTAQHRVCLNAHLRPVVNMLLFSNGELLLLSERECEGLLEQLWRSADSMNADQAAEPRAPNRAAATHLLALSYARIARQAGLGGSNNSSKVKLPEVQMLAVPLTAGSTGNTATGERGPVMQHPGIPELVCAQLFDGNAMYDGDEQQLQYLKSMMKGHIEAAEALLEMRGKQASFPRSQLQLACDTDWCLAVDCA